jgi:type VI secretion system protein ImpB
VAKEGSVAPKERINVKYKPATGDMKEDVELPLKLVMLGDYTLREDDTPLEERTRINVDKDNFSDVMRSQELAVDVKVRNTLAEDDPEAELAANLKFETLKDFEPEQLARQVPELRQLLELRQALVALKGPLGNVPAFRKAIEETLKDADQRDKLMKELGVGAEPKE